MIGLRPSTSKVGLSFLPHLSPLLSRVYRNLFKYLLEVPIRTSCDTWLSSRKSWSTGSPWGRKFNVCYIWFFDPQSTVQRMILKKDKKDVMDGLGIFIFSYLDHRPFCTFFAEHWKQRTSLYLVKEEVWKVVWSDVRWCEMMWDDVRWGAKSKCVELELCSSISWISLNHCGVLNQSQTSATIRSESLISC